MNPKTYEKLTHVNYGGATCVVSPLTISADFSEFESVLARLHQFFLHDWGVASGLQVQGTIGSANVQVQAGIAIDRKGNLIVLSTGGAGLLGDTPPLTEVPVPVAIPTASLTSQKYLLTIQWHETHRAITSPPDFFCGKQEQTPQLRLQPVTGFTDADDFVCLAVIELDTGGVLKSIHALDATAPLSRRRLGETIGALSLESPTDSNPMGSVQETSAGVIAALPGGNGLQITAGVTGLTGKLCIGQLAATPPPDVAGSLIVLSSTPGGGGGVETRDSNGKRMAVLTTTGTAATQAGYIGVNSAAGTEVVSLSASASGAGQVQVQTRAGQPAVVLNTTGTADDGVVHILSNNQDVITLGPGGVSSQGNITTQGSLSSQGGITTTGAITAQGSLTAASLTSQGAITAQGSVQVQTRAGQPAVVLNTTGTADDGVVHILSNNQDLITLGPGGVSSKGNITTQGSLSSQGGITTTGAITAQGSLTAASLTSQGAIAAQGNISSQGSLTTQGSITANSGITAASISSQGNISAQGVVSCNYVSGQGWTAFNGGISGGNSWSLQSGGVWGNGWALQTSAVWGQDWTLRSDAVWGKGWTLQSGGVWGDGWNMTKGSATVWNSNGKNVVSLGAWGTGPDGYLATTANDGHTLVELTTTSGGSNAAVVVLNSAGKSAVQLEVQSGGAGLLSVRDANGNPRVLMDGGSGTKSFVLPHPNDPQRQIVYASLEGPEGAAYCRGRASLKDGLAEVSFPEHFALVVNAATVTIQVTPRSADSKGLAVTGRSDVGFRVRELGGGTGTYEFDYFATGVRKGFEGYQAVVPKGISPLGQPMMGETTPAPREAVGPVVPPPPARPAEPAGASPAPVLPAPPSEKPEPWNLL
jgi:hypothetical protein